MSAESAIAAVDDSGANTASEVRAALTSILESIPIPYRVLATRIGSSAHSDDLEFDSDPSGTAVTPTGNATWTVDTDFKVLSSVFNTTSGTDRVAYLVSLTPTTYPVTIECAVSALLRPTQKSVGLCFTDGTSDTSKLFGLEWIDDNLDPHFKTLTNQMNSITTSDTDGIGPAPGGVLFLRIIWTAANTFAVAASPTGADGSWSEFNLPPQSVTLTPTHFGVLAGPGGGTTDGVASWFYVRVYESDLSV